MENVRADDIFNRKCFNGHKAYFMYIFQNFNKIYLYIYKLL